MPTPQPLQDLEVISKISLSDTGGRPYLRFRQGLQPRFGRVFLDILLGYLFLSLSVAVPFFLYLRFPRWTLPLVAVSAVGVGYWIAYLELFIHEASHFNIARNKGWNDLLSDVFIGSWAGLETASYRVIHWDHHRLLGKTTDTEHSYFDPLNLRFFLLSLTGVGALKVLLFRGRRARPRGTRKKWVLLGGILLHAGVTAALASGPARPFAAAWVLGLLMFFPFFGALRQLLEHRSAEADDRTDYTRIPHGKTTRMFKEGPLGSTFGAAGFTRHLLHHWDPQVSYTRLADIENFLMKTHLRARLAAAKTTYLRTFFQLLRS